MEYSGRQKLSLSTKELETEHTNAFHTEKNYFVYKKVFDKIWAIFNIHRLASLEASNDRGDLRPKRDYRYCSLQIFFKKCQFSGNH